MENRRILRLLAPTLLLAAALAPRPSFAAEPKPAESVKIDATRSMAESLKGFVGRDVYLDLRSGKTLLGYLRGVGDHVVHLEKIAQKDYFDAVIRIEDISAVEVQVRGNR